MPTNEQGSWTGQAGRLNDDGYIRRACPQRVPQGSPPKDCIAHTINTGNQVRVKHIHHHTYTTRDTRTSIRKPARHSNQSTYGLLTHTHNTQPQLGKNRTQSTHTTTSTAHNNTRTALASRCAHTRIYKRTHQHTRMGKEPIQGLCRNTQQVLQQVPLGRLGKGGDLGVPGHR